MKKTLVSMCNDVKKPASEFFKNKIRFYTETNKIMAIVNKGDGTTISLQVGNNWYDNSFDFYADAGIISELLKLEKYPAFESREGKLLLNGQEVKHINTEVVNIESDSLDYAMEHIITSKESDRIKVAANFTDKKYTRPVFGHVHILKDIIVGTDTCMMYIAKHDIDTIDLTLSIPNHLTKYFDAGVLYHLPTTSNTQAISNKYQLITKSGLKLSWRDNGQVVPDVKKCMPQTFKYQPLELVIDSKLSKQMLNTIKISEIEQRESDLPFVNIQEVLDNVEVKNYFDTKRLTLAIKTFSNKKVEFKYNDTNSVTILDAGDESILLCPVRGNK